MKQNRGTYAFMMFLPMVAMLVLQLVISVFVTEVLTIKGLIDYTLEDGAYLDYMLELSSSVMDSKVQGAILTIYAVAACILFSQWHIKATGGRVKDLSLKEFSKKLNLPLYIVSVVAMVVGTSYASESIINFFSAVKPEWIDMYNEIMELAGFDEISVWLVLSAVILGPIAEELTFRGLTLGYARSTGMKVQWAIVLQALLFAVVHGNMVQGSYAFILGLLMGYAVYKTGNLWASIIIHIGFNFIGTMIPLITLPGESLVAFFVMTFGAMVLIYVSIILLNKSLKKDE